MLKVSIHWRRPEQSGKNEKAGVGGSSVDINAGVGRARVRVNDTV